jgi:hypothetical protein
MADLVTARHGGKFTVEVKHNFGPQNLDLLDYLKDLDQKLKKGVIRKMVTAAGTVLVKQIRKEIKERNMPNSRATGKDRKAIKAMKAQGTVPLVQTIGKRTWSKERRGIIGCVVGPVWPQGAHGHLVEFGHKITGKARLKVTAPVLRRYAGKGGTTYKLKSKTFKIGRHEVARTGERTIAHGFQQAAMAAKEREIWYAMANKMAEALRKAGSPHIKQMIINQQQSSTEPTF